MTISEQDVKQFINTIKSGASIINLEKYVIVTMKIDGFICEVFTPSTILQQCDGGESFQKIIESFPGAPQLLATVLRTP